MALYVVQHGLSLPKEQDPQKGLSPAGKQQVEHIARVAAGYKIPVRRIVHSKKNRAVQTARIFGDFFSPDDGVHPAEGINPLDEVAPIAAKLDMSENQMIVGHLPFLERLVAFMVSGQAEKPVMCLQNGGIVCLDNYPQSDDIVIKWAIMPKIP